MKLISIFLILIFVKSSLSINTKINDDENLKLNISFQNSAWDNYFDLSKIVRSPVPLHLDIVAVVTQQSIKLFRSQNIDMEIYFHRVFAGVSKIFSWHNIRFSVSRMEYWNKKSSPKINDKSINGFVKYFKDNNYTFDSHLVFRDISIGPVGYGFIGKLCTADSVALIKTNAYLFDPTMMSYAVAHEIGHNMGFQHTDYLNWCKCAAKESKYCLMYSFNHYWYQNSPKSIENCRMNKLLKELNKYQCLLKPLKMNRLYPTCGDGVVDKGEECDCGFRYLCNDITMQNTCCNRMTCKFFRKTYQCSSGRCCNNCRFATKKLCRVGGSECDLPEYCDGSSNECPANKFKKDYEMCRNNKGFCKNGKCSNLNHLCQHAYNDTEAYFLNECILKAKHVSKVCKIPYSKIEELLCDKPNFWKNFMCALPKNDLSKNRGFVLGKNICIFPLEDLGQDQREFAANYVQSWFLQKKITQK